MQTDIEQFVPNPKQREFLAGIADPRFNIMVAVGGAGAGKSHTLVRAALDCAVTIPGNKVVVARKTLKDCLKTTFREFMSIAQGYIAQQPDSITHEVLIHTADPLRPSVVTFIGIDDADRLGSTQFTQAFFDEGNEFELRDFITMRQRLRHPLDRDADVSGSPLRVWNAEQNRWDVQRFIAIATNPIPNPKHWLFQLYKHRKIQDKEYAVYVVRIPTYDNRAHLPADYIATLEDQPEEERRRMLLAEDTPGLVGDACTPHFINRRQELGGHIITGSIPQHALHLVRGWDFGYRHAAVKWGEVMDKSVIYIWAETHTERKTLDELCAVIRRQEDTFHENTTFAEWVDHQAANQHSDKSAETCRDIMRRNGLRARSEYSRPRDRADLVDNLFRAGRLFIHESCRDTINACSGFWRRDSEGEPEKDGWWDHHGDALGYLVWNEIGNRGLKGRTFTTTDLPGQQTVHFDTDFKTKVDGKRGFALPSMGGAA